MAKNNPHPQRIIVQEAEPAHIPSLTTMDIRAFHPINAYHRAVFPNTPQVLDWFAKVFSDEIKEPNVHVIVAIDPDATTEPVVGVMLLRLMDPSKRGAGLWTMYEFAPEMNSELFQGSTDVMVEWREKLFAASGQWHYLLEFVGVDHTYKGANVGRKIMDRVFEIADAKGCPVFVEANYTAEGFYRRCGFEERHRIEVGGSETYVQHVMVREPKEKQ